jgi:sulfide:quinone oxidoreductase
VDYDWPVKTRVVVLGAGFGVSGSRRCCRTRSATTSNVTLIDKNDTFVFGYSKLDVMFGRTTLDEVRLPYRDIAKPGVRFLQETITAIDPKTRRATTDVSVHEAFDFVRQARNDRFRHKGGWERWEPRRQPEPRLV